MGDVTKLFKWALLGFFGAIITAIVFVQAGRKGGQSGGEQTATIIKASGKGLGDLASGLESGGS